MPVPTYGGGRALGEDIGSPYHHPKKPKDLPCIPGGRGWGRYCTVAFFRRKETAGLAGACEGDCAWLLAPPPGGEGHPRGGLEGISVSHA